MLVKRATLVRLRDERRIDDAVLRRLQETLDAEEVRLDLRDPAIRGKTAP
jgi:CPA1 family monovalent cation:H+ antiporter